MEQPWRLSDRGRRWFDVLLVAGLLFVGVLASLVSGMYAEAWLVALQIAPLLWRRRQPGLVFAAVATASALQAVVVDAPLGSQVAFPIATYSVARWAPRWQGLAALFVGYAGALVAAVDWQSAFGPTRPSVGDLMPYLTTIGAIVTSAWALGFAAQQRERYVAGLVDRAEQAERVAQREVELAAQDERARIAREMHDVVAHGLSVIVVQADGARYAAAKDPGVAVETLETIGTTGRDALSEMRRMLGLLRSGDTGVRPQPGLLDLPHLVEEARAAGTEVEADLPPPEDAGGGATTTPRLPHVPEGVALTTYRIVQEALTNVRKHAGPGATVRLRVALEEGAVTVDVRDDGRGAAASGDGRGLGLVGMRERVHVHGGTVSVGPATGGGFAVSARIPVAGTAGRREGAR